LILKLKASTQSKLGEEEITMKVSIQDKKDNVLLKRTEVKGTLEFEGATPSNAQLAEIVAKEMKVNVGLVVVKNIYTKFGHLQADFSAVIYKDAEAKKQTEVLTKHMKVKIEEEKKKQEEARAAEKEAKKAEAEAKKAEEEAKKAEATKAKESD